MDPEVPSLIKFCFSINGYDSSQDVTLPFPSVTLFNIEYFPHKNSCVTYDRIKQNKTKTLSSQFLLWNKITGILGFLKSHKTKILNILKYIVGLPW